MNNDKCQLVFTGRLRSGSDRAEVLRNLCALFNAEPPEVKRVFRGKGAVVLKDLSREKALRALQAIARAGAECELQVADPSPAEPTQPASPSPEVLSLSPELNIQDPTLSPLPCNRLHALEDGVGTNRLDLKHIPYEAMRIAAVFKKTETGNDYKLVLFCEGSKRPLLIDVDFIAFGEFPGVPGTNLADSLRRFIAFLRQQAPTLRLDDATESFLQGGLPRVFTGDPVALATALHQAA